MTLTHFSAKRACWLPFLLSAGLLVSAQGHVDGHDRTEPDAASAEEELRERAIGLEYACGNLFVITNAKQRAVTVSYRVAGTKERGVAKLKAAPIENPETSEVQLETQNSGTVELYRNGRLIAVRENGDTPCAPTAAAAVAAPSAPSAIAEAEPEAPAEPDAAVIDAADLDAAELGQWSAVIDWPIVALHLHLLPDGRVFSWGLKGEPQLWNPATGVFTAQPSQDWLFCAGHAFLPDGRLFIAGGHISTGHGLPDINLYTPAAGYVSSPPMQRGRWYPTTTVMADGEVVITAGRDENFKQVQLPEVWTGGNIRVLTGAKKTLPYYPRQFLAPNGQLFYAGELQTSQYLDFAGTGRWTNVGNRRFGNRPYGSAVMYAPGKILYAGGARTTNTAETIDLNQAAPAWQWTDPMAFARRHLNLTVLPNGKVLATGGVGGTTFNDITKPTRAAEIWTPSTGEWKTLASSVRPRGYHATSLLLPDGRVLHTGSGEGDPAPRERNAEIYSPPYLFEGARPTITSAPATAGYGTTMRVVSPDGGSITKVSLIRLGSVTHAFDMNQRYQTLTFTRDANGLNVAVPTDARITPPGHYMLFILNGSGVPSVAKIVRIV